MKPSKFMQRRTQKENFNSFLPIREPHEQN